MLSQTWEYSLVVNFFSIIKLTPRSVLLHLLRRVTFTFTFLDTYLRNWALLEEPLIGQPLKNFPAFHGTRRCNTVFTRSLHCSLSWVLSIKFTPPNLIYLRSILILSIHLRLGSSQWSLSFWLSQQYPISVPLMLHSCYMPRPSHPSWLDHSNYTWRRVFYILLFHLNL
jgi:hypothetical protein